MAPAKKMMAVLVGINYLHTENELRGCINDVRAMKKLLTTRFGFKQSQIQVLTDEPKSPAMPTGANIKAAVSKMIDHAEEGDVLLFHFSGHGTRIPSKYHLKQEEAIVPVDFNLITDLDFRALVNRVPRGASFTIISDSCHSGGLIDKEKEQIGPSSPSPTGRSSHSSAQHQGRSKYIPYETILQHMSAHSGEAASAKLKASGPAVHERETVHPDAGILLSGCQANETSADMPGSEGGEAYGAFSNALEKVFEEHAGALTNRQVVTMARKLLREQGIAQHPCLYCSDENAEAQFLCQP